MTKEGVNKWWNELVSLKNGETIETRFKLPSGEWSQWGHDLDPEFDEPGQCAMWREHRIKPKPRECWVVNRIGVSMEMSSFFTTLEGAEAFIQRHRASGQHEIIHMVETV